MSERFPVTPSIYLCSIEWSGESINESRSVVVLEPRLLSKAVLNKFSPKENRTTTHRILVTLSEVVGIIRRSPSLVELCCSIKVILPDAHHLSTHGYFDRSTVSMAWKSIDLEGLGLKKDRSVSVIILLVTRDRNSRTLLERGTKSFDPQPGFPSFSQSS